MYRVPQAGLTKPAVAGQLERGVRRHCALLGLDDDSCCGRGCVARVWRALRLDEQYVGFFLCARAVLDALWDDVHLSRTQFDTAIAQLDGQLTLQHEEEVVRVVVLVPVEWTLLISKLPQLRESS